MLLIPTRHDDALLAFLRPGYRGATSLLVIINFASVRAPASVTPLCGDTRGLCVLKDLLTNSPVRLALHSSAIQLQPHESLVLRKLSPRGTAR